MPSHPVVMHGAVVGQPRRIGPAALRLHVFAVIVSIHDGRPGLVTHEYLAGIRGELDLPVRQLCSVGLWQFTERGYVVADDEVRRIAQIVRDQAKGGRDLL